jgi:RNA polymerase sigma factor (sigma-70 family)
MQDKAIVEAIQQGNSRVLRELAVHFPSVKSWIMKNSGSVEDAEDVFAEAQIVFYQRVLNNKFVYQGEGKIGGFLFETSRKLWLKTLEKRRRMLTNSEYVVQEEMDDPFENQLVEHEIQQKIDQALSTMGEACAQILKYFIFDKLNMLTIARLLGYKDEKVVKVRKRQCISTLRKSLTEDDLAQLNDLIYELKQKRLGTNR